MFGPLYPVPLWRRILIRIPFLGRLFRRRIKFKSLTFPKVAAPMPEIDRKWFDLEYKQYRLPPEIVHGGSMTAHSVKAALEANSVKKPEDDHE